MPLYVYRGIDAEGSAERRPGAREAHLAHIETYDRDGRVRFAGPLLDEHGAPCGSLIVLEADSFEQARTIANGDPYLAAGVFASVEVFETKAVFPKPR